MFDISELVEKAKAHQGLKSDNELNRYLEHKGPAVSQWKTGRTIPTDESVVKLCTAAGYSTHQITKELVKLAIYRTASTDQVQSNAQWRSILESLSGSLKTVALACMIGVMSLVSFEKPAQADQGAMEPKSVLRLYIMGNYCFGLSALCSFLFPIQFPFEYSPLTGVEHRSTLGSNYSMFDFSICPVDDAGLAPEIGAMPPPIIKGYAATIRCYADKLDRLAADAELRIEERIKASKHRQHISAAGQELAQLVEDGIDLQIALSRVSHKYTVEASQLRLLWPTFKRRAKKKAAIERARGVMIRYRNGLHNAVIASQMDITERQVRRIIAAELEELTKL